MAKIDYDMLVRDNYPSILECGGKKKCNVSTINETDFLDRLADKLEDEVGGFLSEYDAENDERALNKLADITEVVSSIIAAFGMTEDAFARLCDARRAMYGAFDSKILLESIEDVDGKG